MLHTTRSRQGLRRLRLFAVLLALALTAGFLNAQPAVAETGAICEYDFEKPHDSGHKKGTINTVAAVVMCTGVVPDLHLDVQIQKWTASGWKVVPTKLRHLGLDGNLIRVSRSKRCIPGTYQTRIRLFGFGKHHPWHYSGSKLISCGASGGGAGGGGGGSW